MIEVHRARSFKRWLGPWRQQREHALDDAIAGGEASQEDWGGPIYLGVGCTIVVTEAAGPVWPRSAQIEAQERLAA